MATKRANGAAGKPRSLPERTVLVQLGAAVAMRETVIAATRPLASPMEVRGRISELGKRAGERVKSLEHRGEQASTGLQRQVQRVVGTLRRNGG
jgi:hypothetical protein